MRMTEISQYIGDHFRRSWLIPWPRHSFLSPSIHRRVRRCTCSVLRSRPPSCHPYFLGSHGYFEIKSALKTMVDSSETFVERLYISAIVVSSIVFKSTRPNRGLQQYSLASFTYGENYKRRQGIWLPRWPQSDKRNIRQYSNRGGGGWFERSQGFFCIGRSLVLVGRGHKLSLPTPR